MAPRGYLKKNEIFKTFILACRGLAFSYPHLLLLSLYYIGGWILMSLLTCPPILCSRFFSNFRAMCYVYRYLWSKYLMAMAEDFPLEVMSLPQWLQHALKILPDLHQEPMLMLKLSKSQHQQMTNNPSTK